MKELQSIFENEGTDKATHGYSPFYERIFEPFRDERICVAEIGVQSGASIRAWDSYFPNGIVVGIDRNQKTLDGLEDPVEAVCADQGKPKELSSKMEALVRKLGVDGLNIVVDDGSHIWTHQRDSLLYLWPLITPGGIYIVEDVHTSFIGKGYANAPESMLAELLVLGGLYDSSVSGSLRPLEPDRIEFFHPKPRSLTCALWKKKAS